HEHDNGYMYDSVEHHFVSTSVSVSVPVSASASDAVALRLDSAGVYNSSANNCAHATTELPMAVLAAKAEPRPAPAPVSAPMTMPIPMTVPQLPRMQMSVPAYAPFAAADTPGATDKNRSSVHIQHPFQQPAHNLRQGPLAADDSALSSILPPLQQQQQQDHSQQQTAHIA
ncbi:hypothetical protein GGF37_005668, partial [Kickxella alabastrina]